MNDFPASSEDENLRRLVNDAVSDVEPGHSLDEIRSRTPASGSSRRPWIWGVGAAVVGTAATITAVAVMGGNPGTTAAQDPGFANDSPSVAGSKEPSHGVSSPAGSTVTVPVYFVGDTGQGPRLFREFDSVELEGGLSAADMAAGRAVNTSDPNPVTRTLLGPIDPDYRTDWPFGTEATVAESDALISVDLASASGLRERPEGMTAAEADFAIEQVIYTVQATLQTRDPVLFTLDGQPTDSLLGVSTSEPLTEGDPTDVLAQLWIVEPAEGAQVESGFEVTGLANAFEANVQWELMQGEEVVKSGFTTAEECCTMAPYSFTVKAPPGDYTLVVHDSDPSGGEGFPPWEDTKNITVE